MGKLPSYRRLDDMVRIPADRPFPVAALPPVLREFVEEVAASVPCDPAFAALPALAAAGAAVGGALVVSPKRGFAEPPILWMCTVGDSGTGKSPAAKPTADLVFAIDSRLKAEYFRALAKYKADLKAWKEQDEPDPGTQPVSPARVRFALVDITLERLTVEAAQNPRGLVVVRDELAGWFQSFARYKGSAGGSDVPNWLSMFDGGAIRYHRRTGEPKEVEADRAFVAVFGGIQPDVLRAILSDPGFIASGLAARVGFAMPPKACPKWSDRELSDETERAFAGVLESLRGLPFDPKSGPARVRLECEALARFKRLNDEFAEAAEDLDGGPMAAVLPKAVRLALRLALAWQCVAEAAAGRDDPGRGSVTAEAMAAGEELARWLVAEAERVYAVLAERPEDREVRTLAEWAVGKGTSSVKPFKPSRACPLPADAEIVDVYGRPHVQLKDRGKTVLYPLSKNRTQYLRPLRRWYFEYKDATGTVRRVKGFADLKATEQLAAETVRKAERARAGNFYPADEHVRRPLAEHLASYTAHLAAKGDVAAHVRETRATVAALFGGCGFVFLADVDAGKATEWLNARRTPGHRPELPPGIEWFTTAEAAKLLGLTPAGLRAAVQRHRLTAVGAGKSRRLPRATVQTLADRATPGASPATTNHYIRAVRGFFLWMVRAKRTGSNPLESLTVVKANGDVRRVRRELTADELQRLFVAARESDRAYRGLTGADRYFLYLTGVGTGVRARALTDSVAVTVAVTGDIPTHQSAPKYTFGVVGDSTEPASETLEKEGAGTPQHRPASDCIRVTDGI